VDSPVGGDRGKPWWQQWWANLGAGFVLVGLVLGLTALGTGSVSPLIAIGALVGYYVFVSKRWPDSTPRAPGQRRIREQPRRRQIVFVWVMGTLLAMGAVVVLKDLFDLTPSIWLARVFAISLAAAGLAMLVETWARDPDGSRPSTWQARFRAYPRSRQVIEIWCVSSLMAVPWSFVLLTLIEVTAPLWVLWALIANAIVASAALLVVTRWTDPGGSAGLERSSH
jgi:hypothetical protein